MVLFESEYSLVIWIIGFGFSVELSVLLIE